MKTISLFLAMAFLSQLGIAQTQIGTDIIGEKANDLSAYSISLSGDGKRIAVGAYLHDTEVGGSPVPNAGNARVFENVAGVWTQIGGDIEDGAINDFSGHSVALNGDGSILAVGAPRYSVSSRPAGQTRVYQYSSGSWLQIGSTIDGESTEDRSGWALALSADGNTLAIGEPYGSSGVRGQVRVFQNVSGTWTKIGGSIIGQDLGDEEGYSVAISDDGKRLAMGAINNNDNGSQSGQVRVFEVVSGSWTQVGTDIEGAINDRCGRSVALSADGKILAVGFSDYNGFEGKVNVYQEDSGSWNMLGSTINGADAGDHFGFGVSLSNDGNTLAVGARGMDRGSIAPGATLLFENDLGTWKLLGDPIYGKGNLEHCGNSVSLSADGRTVGFGAPRHSDSINLAGQARVYEVASAMPSSIEAVYNNESLEINFSLYPNPSNGKVQATIWNPIKEETSLNVFDINGRLILEKTLKPYANSFKLEIPTKGIYLVGVEKNSRYVHQRLIIQ